MAYRPARQYAVTVRPEEAHVWLVIKKMDRDRFGNSNPEAMLREFLPPEFSIVEAHALTKKNPMTLFVKFSSEDIKYSAKTLIDGQKYGERLLNAVDHKLSDTAEVMHRAERFDPTPYQVERTAVFTDVKHEANLTFPLKDFEQIIVTQFKDPKLIIDVRTGQFADGTPKSTVFVVFHHAEHARAAIQRGYAFFRGRQIRE